MQSFVNSLCHAMCCCQHPLGSDKGAAAKVLVQRIDQSHLPTPLVRFRVLSAHDPRSPRPGRPFDAAHVLAVRGRLGRQGIRRGQRGHRRVGRIID